MNKIWLFLVLFALVYGDYSWKCRNDGYGHFRCSKSKYNDVNKDWWFLILYNGILEIAINSGFDFKKFPGSLKTYSKNLL